jgi:beta-N-acetylhexosaminidase
MLSFITGLAGLQLDPREAAALRAARPCGVILFARNVADPAQVRRLSEAARDAVGSDILVLVDQEGGRVRRLLPPNWRQLPAAAAYGRLYADGSAQACRIARLAAQLTAAELRACGINTNCVPVLDVPAPGSHAIVAIACSAAVEQGCRARAWLRATRWRRAAGDEAHSGSGRATRTAI